MPLIPINIRIILVYIVSNFIFVTYCYSSKIQNKGNDNVLDGIVYSAKSVHEIIEPKSYIYYKKSKDAAHSHAPLSWLNYLLPTAWFDYVVIKNRTSQILLDVKVKLNTGAVKILPKILLRHTGSQGNLYLQKYIVNGEPDKEYDGRMRIKAYIRFYQRPVLLSRFTGDINDDADVLIAQVRVKYVNHFKNPDGYYIYRAGDEYMELFNRGLLNTTPTIDKRNVITQ